MASDQYRLGLSITSADGHITRWGGDELAAKDVPLGMTFTTSIPGGFKDWTCSLLRKLDLDYTDERLFDDVRVYGPGNETVWNGRMMQFPRQQADQFSVQPGAVGWAAHLRDDPSFREIYVDRDLMQWHGAGVARRLALVASGYSPSDPSVAADPTSGQPALAEEYTDPWGTTSLPAVTAWYDGGGIPLGIVEYAWKKNANVNAAAAQHVWDVLLSTDDVQTTADSSGSLRATGPGTGSLSATAANRLFAVVENIFNTSAATSTNNLYGIYWTMLGVHGRHGLSAHGGITATTGNGYYASDVIADIVGRCAPLLTFTTGEAGSISPTSFVIPHLAFKDPVTAEDAISLINGYHLFEWGVYDNREFFWREPSPDRVTWDAREADGAQVSLEGDDGNNIFNGVFVKYTDPSGRASTVGPPGSVADLVDSSLADLSPTNPVNMQAIPHRWGLLEVTNTTTQAGASQLGAIWLAEHNLPTRRGQITLTGLVQHPTQGKRPVWAIRAGDYIRIADRPDDPVRRIIETSYNHDTRTLTASLDQTVFKIEAIMERLGVNLIGVI